MNSSILGALPIASCSELEYHPVLQNDQSCSELRLVTHRQAVTNLNLTSMQELKTPAKKKKKNPELQNGPTDRND
jgi:hypothetical protein